MHNELEAVAYFAHELLTLDTSTAVGLTASVYNGATVRAKKALVVVEGANVRLWLDGVAPTASVGFLLVPGMAPFVIMADNLASAKFIGATGTPKVWVMYGN